MTDEDKYKLSILQSHGLGYSRASSELGLPLEAVKGFYRRNKPATCRYCGAVVRLTAHKRKRLFCSDKCRGAWWRAHPEQMSHRTLYAHSCQCCGGVFQTPKKDSKFCSRACYARFRRKEEQK